MKKTLILSLIPAFFACAGTEEGADKPKPELASDWKSSIDYVEPAAGGRWTEVQVVESAHPYTNRLTREWTVSGNADTTQMRVVLERFELEAGYDFLTVSGATNTELTGTRTGEEVVVDGNRVTLRFTTDASVTGWGFRARVFRREACICPAIANPVCGVDGQTYSNSCAAQCAGVAIAQQGRCNGQVWTSVAQVIESAHPYTNNLTRTWPVSEGGATSIRVHFTRIETERGYDFVRILDANNRVVASYTGSQTDVTSPAVSGGSLTIQLTSDGSVTGYGFQVDRYDVAGGCTSDAECSAGNSCVQVQCIRAPCFASCQPTANGYTDVTVAQLDGDPARYSGQRVRVVAEPGAPGAACTRRACQPSNPCCNTCTATLEIGENIALRDSSDGEYGCRGNECTWGSTCREFRPEQNGRYQFEGTFMVDSFGAKRFLIDEFRAVDCQRGGCSSHLCGNTSGLISTCEFRPEYACYQAATCEAQGTGHCAFTDTPALQMCLAGARAEVVSATDTPLSIPDNNTTGVSSRIAVTTSGAVNELRVSVDIAHTYRGDLRVVVYSPSGRQHVMHDRTGGSADGLSLIDIPALTFTGESRTGSWRLQVIDGAGQDVGTLNSWSLRFD
ncbi:MAG: proprotein convertase P-domain-containing protein [Deltaproteobacteria bacterium]|nr:proprotein convertase P-domain-containing protein [Deltaproteobacteria bacterium]